MDKSIEAQIDENGYGIIRGFIDKNRVEKLSRLCEEVVEPREVNGYDGKALTTYGVSELIVKTRELDDLITDPRLLSLSRSLIATIDWWGMNLSDLSIKYVMPGQDIRSLHRDDDVYPELSRAQPFTTNALLALDPFDEAVGATTVVPGSHRWDHPVDLNQETISVEMDPGDLLMLSGRTWHGHGPNTTTDRRRRAINIYIIAGWLQTGHPAQFGMSEEEVAALPESLRQLLVQGVSGERK